MAAIQPSESPKRALVYTGPNELLVRVETVGICGSDMHLAPLSLSHGRRCASAPRAETAKPVALVADAIKDCSQPGEIVLDPFAGSGSTRPGTDERALGRVVEFGIGAQPPLPIQLRSCWTPLLSTISRHDGPGVERDALGLWPVLSERQASPV